MLRIRKTATNHIHIHNDISNTASHLRKRVEDMEASGKRDGIALDITACLVMLAFTSEARINFIGARKVEGWNEWGPFTKKVNAVLAELEIEPDYSARPYSAIKLLQSFRNIIAHGKPSTIKVDELIEAGPGDRYDDGELKGDWEECLNVDFMRQCSDDINQIWEEFLAVSGIERYETLTHGSYSFDLVEAFEEPE
jgi:hypothetical protein